MKFLIVFYLIYFTAAMAAVNDAAKYVAPKFLTKIERGDSTEINRLDLLKQLHLRSKQQFNIHQSLLRKVSLCDRCHASLLHSQNSYLPILQGQNLDYLFSKILYFKHDKRSFHPLQTVSQELSIEDIMDISLYYANQSSDLQKAMVIENFPNIQPPDLTLESIQSCSECHGTDGNGERLIPAISGQNENYLSYRIREIASDDSRVHLKSVAVVNCEIAKIDLTGSKRLARILALVLDRDRVSRGGEVYHHNCARCHNDGWQGAPKLGNKEDWSVRILQGTRELVNNTVIGKSSMPLWGGNSRLSRNQLTDAIHFMIHQASLAQ